MPLQREHLRRIGNASGNLLRLIEEVPTLSPGDRRAHERTDEG